MREIRYHDARVGGCLTAIREDRPDGTSRLHSTEALQPYPRRITDRLEHWARETPDRIFVARREHGVGEWQTITYAQMLDRARRVGQALVDRGLSPERPVLILSDNDLEHLTLAFGALWAGVPHTAVSPAYSRVSQDFAKLRHIVQMLRPGLVFASHGEPYARAIEGVVGPDVEVVLTQGALPGRASTPFEALLATEPTASGDAAHDRVDGDTIAKIMFTSGSTKHPKGVVVTERMWCANQQMLRQTLAFVADVPPVLVEWLPWNHTFGGNHNVGLVLYNGGTLYIDDGRPTPSGLELTLRNLREISPTVYFNVPRGFDELVSAMQRDRALRDSVFRRLVACQCGGAGLSQATWDAFDALSEAATGARVRMLAGLGMTETSPAGTFVVGTHARAGLIGLPVPGVEVKLVPLDDKIELRFRGPNVMPGYWREPQLTAEAFDDEGYYRTGDAVRWADPPEHGLMFDGRIAEDFKLSTGTFVNVGVLKARVIAAGSPYVQDVVLAGINRDEIAALVFPRLEECRRLAGLPTDAPPQAVLAAAPVREVFQRLVDGQWAAGTGSANRIARLTVLAEPPSIDRGEVTDKGSINQRAVLTRRADLVEAVYAGTDAHLLLPRRSDTP